jgi:hypothetical protein
VPQSVPEQLAPETVQLTTVLVVPVTDAVNSLDFPAPTVTCVGRIETFTCGGGGGGGGGLEPPPQLPNTIAETTASSRKTFRLRMIASADCLSDAGILATRFGWRSDGAVTGYKNSAV